jgi:hypothetical protein
MAVTGTSRTSAPPTRRCYSFKRPTKAFEDAVASGRNAILKLPGAIPGAIGCSGGSRSRMALWRKQERTRWRGW